MICSAAIATQGISILSLIAALTIGFVTLQGEYRPTLTSPRVSQLQHSKSLTETNPDVEAESLDDDYLQEEKYNFRQQEIERIVASLKAGSSLLVIGKPGIGKTTARGTIVSQLKQQGYRTAVLWPTSAKVLLKSVCEQLGIDTDDLEGKSKTIPQLKNVIVKDLSDNPAFIICDDASQLTVSMRQFLERLFENGTPLLLITNPVVGKDIFLKLPRLELQRLDNLAIRQIASDYAEELEIELSPAKLSQIVARSNGIPMLARRAVDEEHLGLDPSYDETLWIDGTPYLIVILLVFTLSRVIGKGTNNATLAMIGMGLTIGVRIVQTLFYSLPRQSKKIGG